MTELIFAPAVDTTILAEGDGIVGADFDFFDGLGGHPAREAGLTLTVEAPGDKGAVVEDGEGERGAYRHILDGKWVWRWSEGRR